MPRSMLVILLLIVPVTLRAQATITPSDIYAQVVLIEQETELVKRYFHVSASPVVAEEINAELQPRHVWQKGYMLQMKLVAFRRKHGLNGIAPVSIEPKVDLDPRNNWSQAQRLLTEIRIIRKLLAIPGETAAVSVGGDKKPLDIFNKLAAIEADWDRLTGAGFDASYTFSQVLRLHEDVNMILRQLNIFDSAIPPAKNPSDTAQQALAESFVVLAQVQRLQKLLVLPVTDLSAFKKTEEVTPANVFNMVCLMLAEVQQIKAGVGLIHAITPPATFQADKTPADVRQLLGYVANELALVEHF